MTKNKILNKITEFGEQNQRLFTRKARLENEILQIDIEIDILFVKLNILCKKILKSLK